MNVHEHRVLTALLRDQRRGVDPLFVSLRELEAPHGQINDLESRGLLEILRTGSGWRVRLTELGRQLAESLPEKWVD